MRRCGGLGLYLLALGLWVGLAWGGAQFAPVDVTFEPILVPPWLLHVRAGQLYAQFISGKDPIKLQDSGGGATILNLAATVSGKLVIVAWIEKAGERNRLQVTTLSPDAPPPAPSELASGISSKVVSALADAQGRVYILDASLGENGNVYITAWDGPNMPSKRVRLDTAGLPSIELLSGVIAQDCLYLFVTSSTDSRTVITVLTYRLSSLELESLAQVAEADSVVFLKSIALSSGPALLYKHQRDAALGVSLAFKNDSSWYSLPIPDTKDLDVAKTAESAWSDGRLLIVLSGEDRGRYKQRIYAAIRSDDGKKWNWQRIDTPEGTSTRAWLPDLATVGDQVSAVWEDSRNIRAAVRMQLSSDRGQSWLARDIQISDRRHFAIRPRIRAHEGKLYIAWYQYRTDARKEADTMLTSLTWQDAFAMAKKIDTLTNAEDKEQLLRQTVADYWDAMIKGDLRRAYARHDPFYKARMPFDVYAAQRGRFIYHSYEIRDIKIDGNVAQVRSTTTFEIPKLLIMGHEQSVPPRDFPINDTWLYVDDGWHRQYIDALSGGSAVNY